MMSGLVVKGPRRPQHGRAKSSSRTTSNNNDSHNEADGRRFRPTNRRPKSDLEDDASTAAFVRRVLCAGHLRQGAHAGNKALHELLPPLTSSNEIDLQLYAIISVIIRDFVQTWYSQITPDHEFVDEVVQVIAHCTRALEQRFRKIDLEALVLVELPDILGRHSDAIRTARRSNQESAQLALGSNVATTYHTLQPHPALDPVPNDGDQAALDAQKHNETIWRELLVLKILDNLLPPEQLRNPCLKALVGEIFSELIIGTVLSERISEPWFIWDSVAKAIRAAQVDSKSHDSNPKPPGRLEQFGLVADGRSATSLSNQRRYPVRSVYLMIINLGWDVLRLALLVYAMLRTAVIALKDAVSLPPRHSVVKSQSSTTAPLPPPGADASESGFVKDDRHYQPLPVLASPVWTIPAKLLGIEHTMSWLTGTMAMLRHFAIRGPGGVAAYDTRLDRLLSHHITTALFDPSRIPTLLRVVRANLFPNNAMPGPGSSSSSPQPSSGAEVAAIKRACARDILTLVPSAARTVYFGPGPASTASQTLGREEWEAARVEAEVLDLFADKYVNKHWIFAVLEVVVCRLFPEIVVDDEEVEVAGERGQGEAES